MAQLKQKLRGELDAWSQSPHAITLALFALFLAIGLAVAAHSLTYYWFWDDLHLVRVYSEDELKSVFVGDWDVDRIETPGYRPLTTVFNHVRASIMGEDITAQRVFIISLFAACLALFTSVAARVGIPRKYTVLGCVLALWSRENWFNLVWVSDGIHVLIGFLIILAILSLIAYLEKPAILKIALCFACAGLALLTREEALAAFPLIPAFGLGYTFQVFRPGGMPLSKIRSLEWVRENEDVYSKLKVIVITSAWLIFVVLVVFSLRRVFVPNAPIHLDLVGWLNVIHWSLVPMGQAHHQFADGWLRPFWNIFLALLPVATLVSLSPLARRQAIFWLACLTISATVGITAARTNLLFFPILFFSVYLMTLLGEMAKHSARMASILAFFLPVLMVLAGARSMDAQEIMHPLSLLHMCTAHEILAQPNAKVPNVRLAKIRADWANLGINSEEDYQKIFPLLVEQAKRQNWRRPNSDGNLFIPVVGFFEEDPATSEGADLCAWRY